MKTLSSKTQKPSQLPIEIETLHASFTPTFTSALPTDSASESSTNALRELRETHTRKYSEIWQNVQRRLRNGSESERSSAKSFKQDIDWDGIHKHLGEIYSAAKGENFTGVKTNMLEYDKCAKMYGLPAEWKSALEKHLATTGWSPTYTSAQSKKAQAAQKQTSSQDDESLPDASVSVQDDSGQTRVVYGWRHCSGTRGDQLFLYKTEPGAEYTTLEIASGKQFSGTLQKLKRLQYPNLDEIKKEGPHLKALVIDLGEIKFHAVAYDREPVNDSYLNGREQVVFFNFEREGRDSELMCACKSSLVSTWGKKPVEREIWRYVRTAEEKRQREIDLFCSDEDSDAESEEEEEKEDVKTKLLQALGTSYRSPRQQSDKQSDDIEPLLSQLTLTPSKRTQRKRPTSDIDLPALVEIVIEHLVQSGFVPTAQRSSRRRRR